MIDKADAIELLEPLLTPMPNWWLRSRSLYQEQFSEAHMLRLGPNHRALYLNRMTIGEMRDDPVVTGNFVPVNLQQLECLHLEGMDGTNVCVSFNKAERHYRTGELQISGENDTYQSADRANSELLFGDVRTITLVCFYVLKRQANPFQIVYERIGIGARNGKGFEWWHTLWSESEGFSHAVVHPQLPLIPAAKIRLKKPAAVAIAPNRAGHRQEEEKQEQRRADKQRVIKPKEGA